VQIGDFDFQDESSVFVVANGLFTILPLNSIITCVICFYVRESSREVQPGNRQTPGDRRCERGNDLL
jgi:hypothetical protein